MSLSINSKIKVYHKNKFTLPALFYCCDKSQQSGEKKDLFVMSRRAPIPYSLTAAPLRFSFCPLDCTVNCNLVSATVPKSHKSRYVSFPTVSIPKTQKKSSYNTIQGDLLKHLSAHLSILCKSIHIPY